METTLTKKLQQLVQELKSLKYQMNEGFGSDIEPQIAYLESIIVALENIQFTPINTENKSILDKLREEFNFAGTEHISGNTALKIIEDVFASLSKEGKEEAECVHPFASVISKCNGEYNKCLKCGETL